MDPRDRIVTQLPLDSLWDDEGSIAATRGRTLAVAQVAERLRLGAPAVTASVGEPLRWLRGSELFDWWQQEAKPRLLDPQADHWSVKDLPGERGWLATEWVLPDASVVVSFEEFH